MPNNHLTGQNGMNKKDIHRGLIVDIVLKKDQASGILTRIIVDRLLTNIPYHPRGIKVMGTNGMVGRVQYIIGDIDIDKLKIISVGRYNNIMSNYMAVEKEINDIKRYEMDIYLKSKKLSFNELDNGKENCMFNVIRNDRNYRMYNTQYNIPPMYADFFVIDKTIVRLAFYEYREDKLQLVYDFRSKFLEGVQI